jgi:cytosine deaminase
MDLLIRSARIRDDRPPVDIAITGGRIVALDAALQVEAAQTIDAHARVVLPGFVEPHLHLDKALVCGRQRACEGTLAEAIRLTRAVKAEQQRADVLARSRAVLDMALLHGTVFARVHADVDTIQGLLGVETALELRDRYHGLIDLQVVAFPQEGIVRAPGTHALMEEAMRMGADVVGGCPYNEPTLEATKRHVDLAFALAQRFDAPLDLHADFADDVRDARFAIAGYVAERTLALDYRGRVALGHVTSLASLSPEAARPVIERLRAAAVTIVSLPATDLYLGGRGDECSPRRGLAPVRLLRDAGVNVTYSSNNVRNAFTPFGKADMLQIGNLLAHAAQLGTPEQQDEVLRMATYDAARALGLGDAYGLRVGCPADLAILDCTAVADVLSEIPPPRWVLKRGVVVAETRVESVIRRPASVR